MAFFYAIQVSLSAQETFMATYVGGQCFHNGSKIILGTSFSLQPTDQLSVGGTLVLNHVKSGSAIRFSTSGEFTAKQVLEELSTAQTSTQSKMVSFIVGEVFKNTEDINQNRHKHSQVVAAVERGDSKVIDFFFSQEVYFVFNLNSVHIVWYKNPLVDSYTVTVENTENKLIDSKTTTDTLIILDLNNPAFVQSTAKVTIASAANPLIKSTALLITPISSRKNALGELKAAYEIYRAANQLPEQPTSSQQWLAVADFYNQKGLVIDALGAYRQAWQLADEAEKTGIQSIYQLLISQTEKTNQE